MMDRRNFLKSLVKLAGTATIGAFIQACSSLLGQSDSQITTGSSTLSTQPADSTHAVKTVSSPRTPPVETSAPTEAGMVSEVGLVISEERSSGLIRALQLVSLPSFRDQDILIKPNFNSSDPAPGATDPGTLSQLITFLKQRGARRILVGDRSGMGNTRQVFSDLGIFNMAEELGFEILIFDELGVSDWQYHSPEGSHWSRGFALPKILHSVDLVIQMCCLKTHRFGGHFTMSLKNSIGLVAKMVPGDRHNYMSELHDSEHQRQMIAEVNTRYSPDLVILDGFEAFIDGGPDIGSKVQPGVFIVGTDRLAIDAIGVAILRKYGTTGEVQSGAVFGQEQIARAIELGLGASNADEISILTDRGDGAQLAAEIRELIVSS